MDRPTRIQSIIGFAAVGLITVVLVSLATVTRGQQLPPPSPTAVPSAPPTTLPPPVAQPPQAFPPEQSLPSGAQPLPGPIGVLKPDDASGIAAPAVGGNSGAREPGYLGVIFDDRQENGAGVRVMDLETGGPADKGGLKQNDLITSLNGRPVRTEHDMLPVLQQLRPGSKVSFGVDRDAQKATVDVTLGARPPAGQRRYEKFGRIAESLPEPNGDGIGAENAAPGANGGAAAVPPPSAPGANVPQGNNLFGPQTAAPSPPMVSAPEPRMQVANPLFPSHRMLLGVRTQSVTEETQQRLGLASATGALVVSRTLGSPAARAGVPIDAVITAVDGRAILSPQDLTALITAAGPGREVEISYLYKGAPQRAKVRLADAAPAQSGFSGGDSGTVGPIPAPPSPQGGSFPVADDKARIGALEQRVERLEHRIDDLERQVRRSQ